MSIISGKVARILNTRSVVLNRGSKAGLSEGMLVGILDSSVQGIKDPDTGEEIGGLRVFRVALRIEQVSDRLSVASTYKTWTENLGGEGTGVELLMRSFQPPRYVERVETLEIDEDDARPIAPERSRVKVGDEFEVISEEEAEGLFDLA